MKKQPTIIDLSVGINHEHWEPEAIKRRVIDHRQGADLLGRSYEYFQAKNWLDRVRAKWFRSPNNTVTHRDFPDQMGLSLMIYELTTHTGTHLDAPFHYGWRQGQTPPATISDIPLSWCYGPGVLLDFAHDDVPIDAEQIQEKLRAIPYRLEAGDIVLINTGASAHIGTKAYFTTYRGIEPSGVAWLIEQNIRVIGTDAFSFDKPFMQMLSAYRATGDQSQLWPTHVYGRDKPYIQIERLGNLEGLPAPVGFTISCFPIKLEKADAAWSRVVAIFEE